MLLRHREKETNIFHPKDVKYPIYTPKKAAFGPLVPVVLSGCKVDGPIRLHLGHHRLCWTPSI